MATGHLTQQCSDFDTQSIMGFLFLGSGNCGAWRSRFTDQLVTKCFMFGSCIIESVDSTACNSGRRSIDIVETTGRQRQKKSDAAGAKTNDE
jgi:hypothetical protein